MANVWHCFISSSGALTRQFFPLRLCLYFLLSHSLNKFALIFLVSKTNSPASCQFCVWQSTGSLLKMKIPRPHPPQVCTLVIQVGLQEVKFRTHTLGDTAALSLETHLGTTVQMM